MEIFIGNLPPKASAFELRRLFNPVVENNGRRFLFWRLNSLEYMNFRIVEQRTGKGLVRYGVAQVEPDWMAEVCLSELNHSFLMGQPLLLREYHRRSYMNERRAVDWRTRPWDGKERRQHHRREYLLHDISTTVTSAHAA